MSDRKGENLKTESAVFLSTKRFPLRLCEVLEKEFETMHGPLSKRPDWQMELHDICFEKLAAYLESPIQGGNSRAIVAIKDRLASVFPAWQFEPWTPPVQQQLLIKLNELILSDEILFDANILERDSIARQVAELHSGRGNEQSSNVGSLETFAAFVAKDERAQLNRILLEAAFPADAIARVDDSRLSALNRDIHNLSRSGPDGLRSALCLSGGGIRSASFGLGVFGALARRGVLEKFDFLSTVSGGGYIGGWLSAWIHRHPQGLAGVVKELNWRAELDTDFGHSKKIEPEPAPIRFLRDYSHFLNPKSGLFSADTWTWFGIYLRNLALNWLVVIPFLLLILETPRLLLSLTHSWRVVYGSQLYGDGSLFPWMVWLMGSVVLSMLIFMNVQWSIDSNSIDTGSKAATYLRRRFIALKDRFESQSWILLFGMAPVLIFAILLTLLLWGLPHDKSPLTWMQIGNILSVLPLPDAFDAIGRMAFDHLLAWGEIIIFFAWFLSLPLLPKQRWSRRFRELMIMLLAGIPVWTVISELADYASQMGSRTEPAFALWSFVVHPAHVYAVLAVPALMVAALAGITLFIGVASNLRIGDDNREWWARVNAWMMLGIVGWIVLFSIVIFGPPLLLEFPQLFALGTISGLLAVLLGKSSLTAPAARGASSNNSTRFVSSFLGQNALTPASIIFISVFLALLSLLTSAAFEQLFLWINAGSGFEDGALLILLRDAFPAEIAPMRVACGRVDALLAGGPVFDNPQLHLEIVCQTQLMFVGMIAITLVIFIGFSSLIVNLNKFSLHAAYRIRIVRTFLGASRGKERRAHAFTDFDPLDDMQMHELQPGLLRESDIYDIARFVNRLRDAILKRVPNACVKDPMQFLAGVMLKKEYALSSNLADLLKISTPDARIFGSTQKTVLEMLNRVVETIRFDEIPAFMDLRKDPTREETFAMADSFYRQGRIILGNRMLIEAAFPEEVRKFEYRSQASWKLLHVINLTLNLARGRRLSWQERKAAPFVVTPMFSGNYYLGFRESHQYGGESGISMGTAMAISGAAVSPNMGYSSSTLTTLLLMLFNVRLGWWLGNPGIAGENTYRRSEPKIMLRQLGAEAFGLTDDQSPYIYLSDGGHFENMGLFEMVLRRCRLIVVADAGADPNYEFEDLGNAVRKIRIDLGIPIEFDALSIRRSNGSEDRDGRYCAIGRIRYSDVDGRDAPDGLVICFKPVLCGTESHDVQNYAAKNPHFPQESTANQFYGESQFESYRQLGEIAVETAFGGENNSQSDNMWAVDIVTSAHNYLGHDKGDQNWVDSWLTNLKKTTIGEPKRESI